MKEILVIANETIEAKRLFKKPDGLKPKAGKFKMKTNKMIDSRASKVILVDVDGVLCDWEFAFEQWIRKNTHLRRRYTDKYDITTAYDIDRQRMDNYIQEFNSTDNIEFLPPFRDAIYYVKMLHEKYGMIFHAITLLGTEQKQMDRRFKNLVDLFGSTVFTDISCLPPHNDKRTILSLYEQSECFYVEDNVDHARTGLELGLESIIMKHVYNTKGHAIATVNNWHHFTTEYFR